MQDTASLFVGSTPAPARAYLGGLLAALRDNYRRLVIPCCGKFAIAEVAINAGWSPDRIDCSDVSLFSTVIGYLATDQPLSQLNVRLAPAIRGLSYESAGAILYALKLAHLEHGSPTYYLQLIARELRANRRKHIRDLDNQARTLADRLHGIRYRPMDMWRHLAEVKHRSTVVLYLNPPIYERGYTNLYETGGRVRWDEPAFDEFSPRTEQPRLRDALLAQAGLAIFYRYRSVEEHEAPLVIFGSEYEDGRVDYLLANRPAEILERYSVGAAVKPLVGVQPSPAPMLGYEDEITPDSVLRFVMVPKNVALYYHDLWAHRLGVTNSRVHYLALVDGKVFGVLGLNFDKFERNVKDYIFQQYGFTAPHSRYELSKLLMMALVSAGFRDHVLGNQGHFAMKTPTGVRTVGLSPYPEVKSHRGVMKLIARERAHG